MFVLVLRHYMTRAPELKGFLAALKDERVARALAALHRKPGEGWRVDTLASEAGMSRTVFAERFTALLGRTPMQYLAAWRMHLADEMLRSRSSVAQVADRLGIKPKPRSAARSSACAALDRATCAGERRLLKLNVRCRKLKRRSTRSFPKSRSNG